MTQTSPVTISNFIAAVLIAGVAIVVINEIVVSQISGASSSVDMSAVQELEAKISSVCNGNEDSAQGEVSLSSGVSIVLEDTNMRIEGVDPDNIDEGQQTEWETPCAIESRKVLENTELYTITSSGGSYRIR